MLPRRTRCDINVIVLAIILLTLIVAPYNVFAGKLTKEQLSSPQWADAYRQARKEKITEKTVDIYTNVLTKSDGKEKKLQAKRLNDGAGQLAQCAMFRYAQVVSLENRGANDHDLKRHQKKSDTFFYHFSLFIEAGEVFFDEKGLADTFMTQYKAGQQGMFDQHVDSMRYDTEARKERYDFFERDCTKAEENLDSITDVATDRANNSPLDPRIEEIMNGVR